MATTMKSTVSRTVANRSFEAQGRSPVKAAAMQAKSTRAVAVRGGSFFQGAAVRAERKFAAAQRQVVATVASATTVDTAHGGVLVDLMVPADEQEALIASCDAEMELSDRNACDVELLSVGGFSPLTGFVDEETYLSIINDMCLKDGTLFGLPIVLDTDSEDIKPGMKVLLKYKGLNQAVLTVESKYLANKPLEAKNCYGTTSIEHPGVQMISFERGQYYLSGPVQGLAIPERPFPCKTPAEVRAMLPADKDVVAFQCRNPVHRAHYELFTRALDADNVQEGSVCLVHPTCGPTQGDDISGEVRYQTYEVLKEETNNPNIFWAYLPYSMHMAGPREAIQHMLIRKNYGCTHFIIGRDMAGSKSCLDGEDFYGAYDAQDLANASSEKLGMKTVPSLNLCYTEEEGYVTADVADAKGLTKKSLSGTKFRKMLRDPEAPEIPEWFAFKSVVKVLRDNL